MHSSSLIYNSGSCTRHETPPSLPILRVSLRFLRPPSPVLLPPSVSSPSVPMKEHPFRPSDPSAASGRCDAGIPSLQPRGSSSLLFFKHISTDVYTFLLSPPGASDYSLYRRFPPRPTPFDNLPLAEAIPEAAPLPRATVSLEDRDRLDQLCVY